MPRKGYKQTEDHRRHISEARKDIKFSDDHRKHLSKAFIGRKAWNKGLTKEIDERVRLNGISIGKTQKRTHFFEKTKKKRSAAIKLAIKEGRCLAWGHGIIISKEARKRAGKSLSTRWQDLVFREKMIKAVLKGLFKRPTSLELKFIELIKKYNFPYEYVGDGSLIIGYKNPDFINTNGEKICIEVRPKSMCQIWSKCSSEEYERKCVEHYTKYGWKCIVLWSEDIDRGDLHRLS